MSTHYRLLTAADAAAYQSLRLQSYQEAPFAFSESYEDESQRSLDSFQNELVIQGSPPASFVLGAFHTDYLIGFVKFRRDQRSKARHKAMVHAMYVSPGYRSTGVGQTLMELLLQKARKLTGLEQVHLWVLHAQGHSAADFYHRIGFRGQGPLVIGDLKWQDQYIDAEYMTLRL